MLGQRHRARRRAPSRLYVGSTLRPGAQAESSSGVFRVDVLRGGQVEVLKSGRVTWKSGAVAEIARAVTQGSPKPTRRVASHEKGAGAVTVPAYLTIENDGDVALVAKSGVPMWQGGLRARVSGLSESPYTAGAFYGDTNPSVTCYTCAASDVTGSAPPSDTLDSGTGVEPMTGDFSTSNPLFDAPAIGGDLSLSLSYDAQLAQSDLTNGTSGLDFGEGWSTNFSSSVTTSGFLCTCASFVRCLLEPLIDVRSPGEYTGELLHMPDYPQEGALRGGHIPGARSVPWARAAAEDATFRTRAELEAIYLNEVGLRPDDDVVVYCRIGERSSHTWFVLHHLLGFPHVRNYDGSWTEWGNTVRVPITRGDSP